MNYEDILYTKENGIATITLNRPEKLNAVTRRLASEVRGSLDDAANDIDIRVIVITGAGRGFCAGIDLKEAGSGQSVVTPAEGNVIQRLAGGLDFALRNVEKPTVAAVNGPAIGMGCDLALACDLRIASESAYFCEAYVRLGMVPSAGAYYLPRLAGLARAFEVLYFGDNISAKDAERMGIVNKVVPDSDFLQATAAMALRLTKVSPIAAKFTKHAVYLGLETDLLKTLEYVTYARTVLERTPDAGEGVKATLEKREPEYKGRV